MVTWEPVPNAENFPGCLGCGHLRRGRRAHCAPYPDGIPLAIASGQVDHMVPRPGQIGEKVFEPIDVEVWQATGERRPASQPARTR
jgi:hypothetical protein